MRCDSCGASDSVFYVRPDGHGGEERLCRACARERGYAAEGDGYGARLDALAGGALEPGGFLPADTCLITCPVCSWTDERLRATGRLGCPECARVFRRAVEAALRRSGGPARYEGKVPPSLGNVVSSGPVARSADMSAEGAQELSAALERAIAAEDFESAAVYRDRLRLALRGDRA